jgi:hypothetical protein
MRLLGSAPKSHLCDQRRSSKVTGLSNDSFYWPRVLILQTDIKSIQCFQKHAKLIENWFRSKVQLTSVGTFNKTLERLAMRESLRYHSWRWKGYRRCSPTEYPTVPKHGRMFALFDPVTCRNKKGGSKMKSNSALETCVTAPSLLVRSLIRITYCNYDHTWFSGPYIKINLNLNLPQRFCVDEHCSPVGQCWDLDWQFWSGFNSTNNQSPTQPFQLLTIYPTIHLIRNLFVSVFLSVCLSVCLSFYQAVLALVWVQLYNQSITNPTISTINNLSNNLYNLSFYSFSWALFFFSVSVSFI